MPIEHIPDAIKEWKARQPTYRIYGDYFDGRHQLRFITPYWATKYSAEVLKGAVLALRENLCKATVYSFTDDIRVDSWGTDTDANTADTMGLPRLLGYLKRESWRSGDAFALVWPDAAGAPRASFQKARLIVPHVDDLNPDVLDWAAKIWRDPASKRGRVNLYYANRLERWQTVTPIADSGEYGWNSADMPETITSWQSCNDPDGDVIAHSFGAVPVCWYKLDADDPLSHGTSILDDVIPLQDGLNSSLAHLLVNQEAYSRPFWYLLNFNDPSAPINPYLAAQQADSLTGIVTNQAASQPARKSFDRTQQSIVTHDGPGPFGQLDPPDLTRLMTVQEGFKIKVCSTVGIPPYLMLADIGNVPSGAALRTLERRRVSRVTSWQEDNTPVFRGLKQLLGMDDGPIEWAPALQLDETERWQIAQIKQSLGYSLEDILADVGETDITGVLARADEAAKSNAARMAQAFMDGQGAASYAG